MATTGVPADAAGLRTFVRRLTGITMPELLSDSVIDDRLAMAYREVESAEDWPWLEEEYEQAAILTEATPVTVIADSATVPSPGNPESVVVEEDATGDKRLLRRISPREWQRLNWQSNDLVTGEPEAYAVFSVTGDGAGATSFEVKLWPHPEDAYTLELRTRQPASTDPVSRLNADSVDFVGFDFRFLHCLPYRAAAMILREEADQSDRADYWLQEYQEVLASMRSFYMRSADTGMIQMGSGRRRVAW